MAAKRCPPARGHMLSSPGMASKKSLALSGWPEGEDATMTALPASELLRSGPGMPFSAPGLSQPLALQRAFQILTEQHLIKSHHL